jgi:SEC-C motif
MLAHPCDTLPLRDEAPPLANHVFIELRAAIEELGGHLTAAPHQKCESADAARRRWVAQMSWAMDPPAVPAWRTPLQATSVTGTRPPIPSGTRKLGWNARCWCGSGQQYRQCQLPLEPRAGAPGGPLPVGSRPSRHGGSLAGASSSLVSPPLGTPGAAVVTAMSQG